MKTFALKFSYFELVVKSSVVGEGVGIQQPLEMIWEVSGPYLGYTTSQGFQDRVVYKYILIL